MSTQAQGSKDSVDAAQGYAAALNKNLRADTSRVEARVFRSNILTMRFIFKNGKVAPFLTKNGRDSEYTTDIKHEIEELDDEIAMRHPNISSKPEEIVHTIEPVEALKARHFKEFQEQMARSVVKSNDAGSSSLEKLNVANSTTISEGAAGSDSNGVASAPATSGIKISIGSATK